MPLLCAWFTDERALAAAPDTPVRPTVAAAAQALLHARRDLAIDDLADALVAAGHPRAEELLAALAEDEPAALCRAVERWAGHEDRRARRVAAVSYATLVAPHVTLDADRDRVRRAALAVLARPADSELHGPVLALLVADPRTRARYLPQAVRAFVAEGPQDVRVPAAALAAALPTHADIVVTAYRDRLGRPDQGAGEVLRALAGIDAPELALHAAGLVRAYAEGHPEDTAHAAAYLDRRLEHGPAARALLLPLLTGLLRDRPAAAPVRGSLAAVLASPGSPASQPARDELLEVLLDAELRGGSRTRWFWRPCCGPPRPAAPGGHRCAPGRWCTGPGCFSCAPPKGPPCSTGGSSRWSARCPGSARWSRAGWPTRRRSGRPSWGPAHGARWRRCGRR